MLMITLFLIIGCQSVWALLLCKLQQVELISLVGVSDVADTGLCEADIDIGRCACTTSNLDRSLPLLGVVVKTDAEDVVVV